MSRKQYNFKMMEMVVVD